MSTEAGEVAEESAGRNIVLCFDGTGDWTGFDTTNVMKVYDRTYRNDRQLVFYSGGVGTLSDSHALSPGSRLLLKLLDLAVATSLRNHVLDGYRFLVRNYRKGDRIYLFGFSRGAFTARLLAALIHSFGLLKTECENLIPYVWQTISEFDSIRTFKESAMKIKRDFAHEEHVTIKFMGLFDTVSSVGIVERFKVFPYTDRNPSVEVIRHAVSINEERNAFPELLVIPDGNDVAEVWFPGVHRDVGGGASDHVGYSNATLNWIVSEANRFGLALDTTQEPTSDAMAHIATFDPYAFLGLYPMKMFDYALRDLDKPNWSYSRIMDLLLKRPDGGDSGFRWYWPNIIHKRVLPENCFYLSPDGELHHEGACVEDWRRVRNLAAPTYKINRFNFPELVGIILGVALSVLIVNRGLDGPLDNYLGPSWPGHSSVCVTGLFILYIVQQGFSQWLDFKGYSKFNEAVPIIGAVTAVLLVGWISWKDAPWLMLIPALLFGALVALISLAPPKPILPAVRAVPIFFVPWFLTIVALWVFPPVLDFAMHWFAMFTGWVVDRSFSFDYMPLLVHSSWLMAILIALNGLYQIVQDRNRTLD